MTAKKPTQLKFTVRQAESGSVICAPIRDLAAQRLAQNQPIGPDALVFKRKPAAGAAQTQSRSAAGCSRRSPWAAS